MTKNEFADAELFLDDEMEWQAWNKRGDPIVHIELGKWADLFIADNNSKDYIL